MLPVSSIGAEDSRAIRDIHVLSALTSCAVGMCCFASGGADVADAAIAAVAVVAIVAIVAIIASIALIAVVVNFCCR